jgi:probable rRNA maturation factor
MDFSLEVLHRPSRPHASISDLHTLASFVLAQEKVKGDSEIAVRIVDDKTIQDLSRHYVGEDHVTDVITFPYGAPPHFAVDIAICGSQAARQAKDVGHSVRDEIRLLLIHGLLHCFGYDDHDPSKRKVMFQRQAQLLRQWVKK